MRRAKYSLLRGAFALKGKLERHAAFGITTSLCLGCGPLAADEEPLARLASRIAREHLSANPGGQIGPIF